MKKIDNKVSESVKKLTGSSVVTFNGDIFPNYGWSVIIVGGISSGKSTVQQNNLLINGRIVNNDYWRELMSYVINKEIDNPVDVKTNFRNYLDIPNVKLDLSNKTDLKKINKINEELDLSNKYKNNLSNSINKKSKILPNLIFEIGSSNYDNSLKDILKYLKTFNEYNEYGEKINGYKISLVWIISNREVAFASMLNRYRQVGDVAFHGSHNVMFDKNRGVESLLKKPSIYSNIDESWCVLTSNFDIIDNQRIDRRLNSDETNNVIKLKRSGKGEFILPDSIKFSFNGDEKNIKDIINFKSIQKSQFASPKTNGLENQDEFSLGSEYYPTFKQSQKWAKTHNNQFLKNVNVYQKDITIPNKPPKYII